MQQFWVMYAETLEPEVKILSLAIKSPGRPDIFLTIPENGTPKGSWFTLKEGSRYSLLFTFQVSNNIVSGLKYTNTVWKTGVKGNKISLSFSPSLSLPGLTIVGFHIFFSWMTVVVDNTKEMLGTFSPQSEPYTYEMPEDTTPSGIFARGSYSARSKVGQLLSYVSFWCTEVRNVCFCSWIYSYCSQKIHEKNDGFSTL